MGTKKWMMLVLSLVLAVTMAGCGGNDEKTGGTGNDGGSASGGSVSESLPSGDVELKLWCEETQVETVQKMVDSFMKEHEGEANLQINLEYQADGEVRDVMMNDVFNGADVFSFPDDQLNSLVAGGVLAPVPDPGRIEEINVEESVSASKIGDTLYAYPMTADNGYFLYYDKKFFTDDDVKTLDSVLDKAASKKKKFSMEFTSGWYLYSFFGGAGLEMALGDDGISNICNWNTKKGDVKGVDVTKELLAIARHPAFSSHSDGEWLALAEKGEVVAAISGTWNAMGVKNVWGADYGACKLPTYTLKGKQVQMSSFVGYKMMGVNYYSKNKEWAHKLAEWMTNEENQKLRFTELNIGPSNIAAAASDEVKQVPAIAAIIEQSKYGVLQRVGNAYWDATTKFANTILDGNKDNKPLQELNDTLVADITAK